MTEQEKNLEEAFNKISDIVLYENYWKGKSGLFSYGKNIEEDEYIDNMGEDHDAWSGDIVFGIQDGNIKTENTIQVIFSKDDFNEWVEKGKSDISIIEWRVF